MDYETFSRDYDAMLRNYTLSMVNGDTNLAEDLAQLVRLRVFKYIGNFREDCKVSTWLYRIIRNTYIAYKRGVKPTYSLFELETFGTPDLLEEYIIQEKQEEAAILVKDTLSRMPEKLRQVLYLFYLKNKKYSEIAEEVGVDLGTVKSRMSRAREVFKSRAAVTAA